MGWPRDVVSLDRARLMTCKGHRPFVVVAAYALRVSA